MGQTSKHRSSPLIVRVQAIDTVTMGTHLTWFHNSLDLVFFTGKLIFSINLLFFIIYANVFWKSPSMNDLCALQTLASNSARTIILLSILSQFASSASRVPPDEEKHTSHLFHPVSNPSPSRRKLPFPLKSKSWRFTATMCIHLKSLYLLTELITTRSHRLT